MENRSSGHLLTVTILCLATGGFGYAFGRQSGEEFGRENAMVHFNEARLSVMAARERAELEAAAEEPVGEDFASHHHPSREATAHVD